MFAEIGAINRPEVLETIKGNARRPDGELLNEVYTPELLEFANGLIRWESSLYHRYFDLLGISTRLKDIFEQNTFAPSNLQNYWTLSTSDLFRSLQGQTMKILNNVEIKEKLRAQFSKTSKKTGNVSTVLADSAYRTYNDILRDGWLIISESMSRMTFYRHVKMLTECGLSRAALQNMIGLDDGAQIISFARFITVDFDKQLPDWYIHLPPKHVYLPKPHLRQVA